MTSGTRCTPDVCPMKVAPTLDVGRIRSELERSTVHPSMEHGVELLYLFRRQLTRGSHSLLLVVLSVRIRKLLHYNDLKLFLDFFEEMKPLCCQILAMPLFVVLKMT